MPVWQRWYFKPRPDDALRRFQCAGFKRPEKGLVLRYLERITGATGRPRSVSPGIYTEADVALLAETDALHSTLSGPATGILRRRAVEGYGDARYERLAGFSVGHLYNLRKQAGYLARRQHWTKTKGTPVFIGERSAPRIRFIPNDRRTPMTPIQAQTLGALAAIITLLLLRMSHLLWLQRQDVAKSDRRRDAQRKS